MSWPIDVSIEEAVFQALHAVDAIQTLDIKRHPQIWEGESAFDAGAIIGTHPSDGAIYVYMGGEALLHAAVTHLLVRWAPPWTSRAWEGITISIEGATVAKNVRLGLKVRL